MDRKDSGADLIFDYQVPIRPLWSSTDEKSVAMEIKYHTGQAKWAGWIVAGDLLGNSTQFFQ